MKIVDVVYNNNDQSGNCDTCDYGSRSIRDMYIEYEDGTTWKFHSDIKGSDWGITESDWMLILCNSSSLNDIINNVKEKMSYELQQDWLEKDIYYEINGNRTYLSNTKEEIE